jgi:hypothetical protein
VLGSQLLDSTKGPLRKPIQHAKIRTAVYELLLGKSRKKGCSSSKLTCDATVRLRATPPAFRLIRKILQSGSLVKVFMAFPFSLMFMDPLSWIHLMPDYQIILNISSG